MKVTILEGTAQEINDYIAKKMSETMSVPKDFSYHYNPYNSTLSFDVPAKKAKEETSKYDLVMHYSHSKKQYVYVKDMAIPYMINVIRKKQSEKTAADLIYDKEYKALVYFLALRLEEEKGK